VLDTDGELSEAEVQPLPREFVPGHEKRADLREHHENEHNRQSMLVTGLPVESDPEPTCLIFIRKQRFDDPQRGRVEASVHFCQ